MKHLLLVCSFILVGLLSAAQNSLYQNLKKVILEHHPEIDLQDRLIAFNVWSIEDAESREANKSFEKTYEVYEHARLKGGSKGIVVVAINKDELSSNAVITLSKDGTSKLISVKLSELSGIATGNFNGVFDSSGNEVYKNLSAPAISSSINHLITR